MSSCNSGNIKNNIDPDFMKDKDEIKGNDDVVTELDNKNHNPEVQTAEGKYVNIEFKGAATNITLTLNVFIQEPFAGQIVKVLPDKLADELLDVMANYVVNHYNPTPVTEKGDLKKI